MFNFKSLLLTTIATLGLAANVQACKNCCWRVYGPDGQLRETIDYARKNADALFQELEQVFNNAQATKKAQEKLADICKTFSNFQILILKSTHKTAQELFADKKTIEAFESVDQKLCDVHGFAETLFPVETAPYFNTLCHKAAEAITPSLKQSLDNKSYIQLQASLQSRTSKDLALPAEIKEKIVKFNETEMMPSMVRLIKTVFDFPIENRALFLEFGNALRNLLKDTVFWTELDKETPNHSFPKTASFMHLQEAVQHMVTASTGIQHCAKEVSMKITEEARLHYAAQL